MLLRCVVGVIYCIQNIMNKKRYIGSTTVKPKYRWRQHITELRNNKHGNPHLQASWNKYGEQAFKFLVVEDNIGNDILLTREDEWMVEYDTLNPEYGYNKRKELGGGAVEFSEDMRRNMSKAQAGKVLSEEHRRNIGVAGKGKKRSKETCRKISEAKKGENNPNFGKHHSEEMLIRMSEARAGENHWNFGKHLSEETCHKIGEAQKGIPKEGCMKKRYIVTEPNGNTYAVKGLTAFCRAIGLSDSSGLSAVANGKYPYHKGYSAYYMSDEERTLYEPLFTPGVYFIKLDTPTP